jgi:alcohol dehydrogenase
MRGVVFAEKGRVEVRTLAEPTIVEPTDALVRVRLAGICGTDLHLVGGEFPGLPPGSVLGHEFAGDVVAVGSAVRRIRVGDRVSASDFTACGRCRWCERGDHWECVDRAFFGTGATFGSALAGAQAEYVRIPNADVTAFAIPPNCSDEAAILVGDNLATAWAAADLGALAPGETVAIVGGGTIGQLTALCASVRGAGAIVVSEPSAERRALATKAGAIAVPPDRARAVVDELTEGDGADLVVEAVGNPRTLEAAFDLVRKRGRIVSVGAHATQTWPLPLARSFTDELSLRFVIGNAYRDRRMLIGLIERGVLDVEGIVAERVSFADAPAAYARMARQEILKAAIDPRA